MEDMEVSNRYGRPEKAQSSHIQMQEQSWVNRKWDKTINFQSLPPWRTSSSKATPTKPPQIALPTGDKVLKYLRRGGRGAAFLFQITIFK